ncbi:M23 family metallopeptidase [Draconibacterium sp.]
MLLSGSFAELRNNHFHSGIDVKTQGRVGVPVNCVADGYVSRISISPSGYGNAIYIDHDNGTTSVYGHLNQFRPDIAEYIKNIQYERKSFRVDIPVLPGIFQISKNEIIALSGNSGSSGGAHLHFELRNTKTENPVNPLKFGFIVKDSTPPKIYTVQISPLSEESHVNYTTKKVVFDVEFADGKYRIKNDAVIPVYGKIGFAIEANDFVDGSANKCGINSMELSVNGVILSTFEINSFSFDDSKKINSYIDYEEFTKSNRRFQRTWLETCSQFGNFEYSENSGVFDPMIGEVHKVKIEIKDAHRNSSILEFSIEGKYREMHPPAEEFTASFDCGQKNQYKTEEFSIELPENSLYTNLNFQYQSQDAGNGYYSSIHKIHKNTVPMNSGANVKIKTKNLDETLQEKALLVNIDPKTGKFSSAGGKFENDWITGQIGTFGNYAVRIDTIPPTILPLNITNKTTLTETDKIRFEIKDDLAGIETIEGLIDGKWALFEYDAKNDMITHYFDDQRFELNKQHDFQLTVSDKKGNTSIYEATFNK